MDPTEPTTLTRQLLDAAEDEKPLDALVPLLQSICAAMGFDHFAVFLIRPGGWLISNPSSPVVMSNYPKPWLRHYLRRSYHFWDPMLVDAYQQRRAVRWGPPEEFRPLGSDQQRIMDEAGEHGITRGLTIPISGSGEEFGLFVVASQQPAEVVDRNIHQYLHELYMTGTYVHAIISTKAVQHFERMEIDLTTREKEVLIWTARGKSSWEISKIINKSDATVNFHIKHAIRKLNASNRCHAVVMATVFQLIDPYQHEPADPWAHRDAG